MEKTQTTTAVRKSAIRKEYIVINAIKIILLATIGLIITIPFFREEKENVGLSLSGIKKEHLLAEKENLYSTIKELDFDHETGKISDDDYRELKSEYTEKALGVLKELDQDEKTTKENVTSPE